MAAVLRIAERGDKTAQAEAVDHALDGRSIKTDQPTEMILRARPDFMELRQRGEFGLGQRLDHPRHENRGVPLHGDPQQKADPLVEQVASG
jgi:hypothetical protein